jgi:membrane protease YdiL (CAAX protease family)
MNEPTPSSIRPAGNNALAPGLAALRAAPRLSKRRAVLFVLGFGVTWIILQILFGLPLMIGISALVGATPLLLSGGEGTAVSMTSVSGSALALGLAVGGLASAALWRRWGGPPLGSMGLRREGTWAREIVVGAALGPLAFALVLAVELAAGWAMVERGNVTPVGLVLGGLGFTGVAVNEEVATRGFMLQVLARAWSPLVALVASSGLFAALHAPNPNATLVAIVLLTFAGLVLAWGYVATGRLWLPIAFHWSWNFAQGPLFGFPVSGLTGEGLLAVTLTGPDWATGGSFGPEAGMLGLLAEAVVVAIILGWRRAGANRAATTVTALSGLAGVAFLVWLAR